MRFISLLLITFGAIVVNSYKVDPNLEDGVYFIPLLTNTTLLQSSEAAYGEPILITDTASPPTISKRGRIGKVPFPTDIRKCFKATENTVDRKAAHDMLSETCDKGTDIPKFHGIPGILVARHASSLAFTCSYAHKQGCAPNEIDDAWSQISKRCGGDDKGGEVCTNVWEKCYGHTTVTAWICHNVM
ncbi:hypothetical protein F5Y09DRAFT_341216 [Xylaria sp. FL1042]|nr:hypothetical protein F5Y09DRAFT_341216 [Xylaria sp. FL1042]